MYDSEITITPAQSSYAGDLADVLHVELLNVHGFPCAFTIDHDTAVELADQLAAAVGS